ncbi:MAG: penicillin-insensitive murein endopeptidase [Elusimicrobia bacterium]|nr:penicillin-insensitive murein endopeptidase [Elusimicrobiota bacterium]
MVLNPLLLAMSLAASAQSGAIAESASMSPGAQPNAPVAPPSSPAAEPPTVVRELAVKPPPPVPFQDELRTLQSQLKVIEAKGPSRSTGRAFRQGRLRNPAQLPAQGLGFRSIRPERRAYYGTDTMIAGLIDATAKLKQGDHDMPPLAVGDISGPKGGRIAVHRSHRSGRDADLVFFWMDEDGKPVETTEFVRFDRRGRARHDGKLLLFDVRRNWNLVRGLLTSPYFGERVKWIFVYHPLRKLLLDYAERTEGDMYLVEYAWRVLQQPGDRAGRHDNHFHLRIDCAPEEIVDGCKD